MISNIYVLDDFYYFCISQVCKFNLLDSTIDVFWINFYHINEWIEFS